jgi:hypothetical protein
MEWVNIRLLTPYSRQTAKHYAKSKRKTSASKGNNYKRSKERRYYEENNYRPNINVNKANRLANLLLNSKRNKIIIKPSSDSYRDSYVRRSYNVELT